MEHVIGIDLGTTNSCVAVVDNGVPKVIPNKGGYKTTPSVVAIAESGRRLVGHIAKRQMITNAENSVYSAKRIIGRKWGHPAVEAMRGSAPFQLVEGPHADIRIRLRDKDYSVAEIAAMVLGEMRKVAEEFLGHPVEKAVITIPAYFNDGQRQATKDAGKIAGLDVIRIINEPTSAALAYGFGKQDDQRIAIYDLGGGTFDISILQIGHGVYEVVATAGDTYLGGEDFDQRIIEWLVFGFAKEHKIDLRKDKMALQRLRDSAERAKCELSESTTAEINLPFIISGSGNEALHLQRTLTRDKLEELTVDLIERTVQICEKTLGDANLKKDDVAEVILVGGMTRMPAVQEAVAKYLGKRPCKGVNPDEVVALGAAIQGAALIDNQTEMLLLDVTPHNLGIMIAGGYAQTIIEANTTVPTGASHVFTTVRDGQTAVKIVVLQGESQRADENEVLGEFLLTGLRDARAGEVEIDVSFEISADGILSVAAKDKETGKEQSITVTATSGLSDDEINNIIDQNRDYQLTDRDRDGFEKLRSEVERQSKEIDKLLPQVSEIVSGSDFGEDALNKARQVVERVHNAIQARDRIALEKTKDSVARTLAMVKGIVSKVNG
ncbi:MAG: molecular chaperone DnaK [Deltaproteobacteria bacterium]|nr:molecular chaperone DnaK [Deltaproteobacteria bacterium]